MDNNVFELGNAAKNYLIDEHAKNKYYVDDSMIDVKNKNDSKVVIEDYVKEGSICLDVGCGAGYLGEILKKCKNSKVYGIDIDEGALKASENRKCFEKLYNFSITERRGSGYDAFVKINKKFDYIIFADVIEHVVSAEDILLFFANYLKPDGELLISLPNIAHFDIIRGLVNRIFNYSHVGLLDNTHLRFYTRDSFKEFIEQINRVYGKNFVISEIGKTVMEPDYLTSYPNMLKVLGKDICVLQYVYSISIGDTKEKNNKEKVVARRKTFDGLEGKLEDLNKKEEALKSSIEENEKLRRRIAELETSISEIYESKSWKITQPIREISQLIREKIKNSK